MTRHRLAFPAFLFGSASLSAGPMFVRFADVGPLASAFWRLALAVVPLWLIGQIIVRRNGADAGQLSGGLSRNQIFWLIVGGFFFAADLAVWHLGIKRTTMANATLFGNSASFMFPLWACIVARQWPERRAATALIIAALGIGLLMGRSADISPRHLAGDLLCVLAGAFYTVYFVAMKHVRSRVAAFPALAGASLAGALMLLPLGLAGEGDLWPHDWTPLLALALGSQVMGQGLIIWALPQLSAVASGIGLLVQPMLAATLGWLVFSERLSPIEAIGMVAIIAALLLVRAPAPKSQPALQAAAQGGGAG